MVGEADVGVLVGLGEVGEVVGDGDDDGLLDGLGVAVLVLHRDDWLGPITPLGPAVPGAYEAEDWLAGAPPPEWPPCWVLPTEPAPPLVGEMFCETSIAA